jgi:ribosomal 50S subunit-associated protein YjgA (DUF615 family)
MVLNLGNLTQIHQALVKKIPLKLILLTDIFKMLEKWRVEYKKEKLAFFKRILRKRPKIDIINPLNINVHNTYIYALY